MVFHHGRLPTHSALSALSVLCLLSDLYLRYLPWDLLVLLPRLVRRGLLVLLRLSVLSVLSLRLARRVRRGLLVLWGLSVLSHLSRL